LWREDAAVRERLAAVHAGPETAVGKAAMGFGAADVAEEFGLGDVTHEADMRGGCVDEPVAVVDAEIAAVPGAAQQGGELPSLTGEDRKDEENSSASRKRRRSLGDFSSCRAWRMVIALGRLEAMRRAVQGWSTWGKRAAI
jgi:hypothetical protein